jgi:hypothetical protein
MSEISNITDVARIACARHSRYEANPQEMSCSATAGTAWTFGLCKTMCSGAT